MCPLIIHNEQAKTALDMLTNEQLGKVFRSLCELAFEGKEPEFDIKDGIVKYAFASFKTQFDIDKAKYDKVVERNKANGSKGGRPKNPSEPKETQENRKNPLGYLGTQENPSEPKKANNNNINSNINNNNNNSNNPLTPFEGDDDENENDSPFPLTETQAPLNIEEEKKEKKSSAKRKEIDIEELTVDFPPMVQDTVRKWVKYKKEQHRFTYKSADTFKGFLKQLFTLADGDVEKMNAIVEQSIANGWQGIFELKQNKIANGNNNQGSIAERLARIDECLIAQGVQLPR